MKKYIKNMISRLLYVFLALNVASGVSLYGMLVNRAARVRAFAGSVKNKQMPRNWQMARNLNTTPEMAQYQQFMPEAKAAAAIVPAKQTIPVNDDVPSISIKKTSHPWLAYLLGLFGFGWGMSTVLAEEKNNTSEKVSLSKQFLNFVGLDWVVESKEEKGVLEDVLFDLSHYQSINKLTKFLQANKSMEQKKCLFKKIVNDKSALNGLSISVKTVEDLELINLMAFFAKDHYKKLACSFDGACFLNELMNNNSTVIAELTTFAKENFDELSRAGETFFFDNMIGKNPDIKQDFGCLVKGKISLLLKTKCGYHIIDKHLIQSDRELAKERIAAMAATNSFNNKVFYECVETIKCDKDVENLIQNAHKDDDFSSYIRKFSYEKNCAECPLSDTGNSLSLKRLQEKITAYAPINTAQFITDSSGLTNLVKNALKVEQEQSDDDYYFLYHGQPHQLGIHLRWFTWLNNENNIVQDGYIFPRIRILPKTEKEFLEEDAIRQRLVQDKQKYADYNHVMFVTWALFENITLGLVATDRAAASVPKLTLKETFESAGYQGEYYVFKKRLQNLEKKYYSLSDNHGQLLQFKISKSRAKESVFLVNDMANPKIEGIGETTDVNLILDTLKNNKEKITYHESPEFVIAITGREPYQCFIHNAVDPAKWAKYEKEEKALQKDIEEYRRKMKRA